MGIFSRKKEARMLKNDMIRMITGYTPSFSTYSGGVYEMDLTVSAIDTFARHVSKANPKIKGSAYSNLSKQWQVRMNDMMTTQQFLYRAATIFKCENNCFVLPVYDQYKFIVGLYPIPAIGSEIVTVNGELMLKYKLNNKQYAIPYAEVGHLKNHQYKNELYGDGNTAIYPTMQLLDTQNQGIIEGIKKSASIRFIGRTSNIMTEDSLKQARADFSNNLSNENNGGIAIYDRRLEDVKQVDSKPFIVDADQAEHIRTNVYNYFGVNEDIMQNNFTEDTWGSFYEGSIEPFLIQLSQVVTSMLYSNREIAADNYVIFESTRLQHANTSTKMNLITNLFDRGFLTHNQGLEILNLPPIPDGDKRFIRLEYADVDNLGKMQVGEETKGDEKDDNQE